MAIVIEGEELDQIRFMPAADSFYDAVYEENDDCGFLPDTEGQ